MGRATGGLALVRAAIDFGAAAVGVVIHGKGTAQVQAEMRETVVAVGSEVNKRVASGKMRVEPCEQSFVVMRVRSCQQLRCIRRQPRLI
eukprot:scaffold72340_cov59-Phaeocystis_antarctica.AAC.3